MYLGIRTPAKSQDKDSEKSPRKPTTPTPNVRRSIGEWEAGRATTPPRTPTKSSLTSVAGPSRAKPAPVTVTKATTGAVRRISTDEQSPKPPTKFPNRTAEAKHCLSVAKLHLKNSRNIKAEIKTGVLQSLDRLFLLVKEAEKGKEKEVNQQPQDESLNAQVIQPEPAAAESTELMKQLVANLQDHKRVLEECKQQSEALADQLKQTPKYVPGHSPTFAQVAHGKDQRQRVQEPLHSVIVTSTDEAETGEEVLNRVRDAVDAKEGWIRVERVRKARDRKIVMGCSTREDRAKLKEKLESAGGHLVVEEVKNKDPLLVLKDVLKIHSDEDVIKGLRNQNRSVFHNLNDGEDRVLVKFKKTARNPHTCHIVLSVSPTIWSRAVDLGAVQIDLQRIQVADQSPLVQCSRCLAYGHSRRYCKETEDVCSHCGGLHLKKDCEDFHARLPPACKNCERAKIEQKSHNAFSSDCSVRRRWDALARAAVAYC